MATPSDLYKLILPECPGVPQPLVDFHVMQAVIRLCADSLWHSYETEPVGVVAGVDTYDVPIDDDTTGCTHILWLKIDGREIPALGGYDRPTLDTVRLLKTPSVAGTLTMRIAVQPNEDATEFHDSLLASFRNAIAQGAKSTLMLIPGKPWTNPTMAMYYAKKFDAAIAQAQVEANRLNTLGELRVTPRSLA